MVDYCVLAPREFQKSFPGAQFITSKQLPTKHSIAKLLSQSKEKPQALLVIHSKILTLGPIIRNTPISTIQASNPNDLELWTKLDIQPKEILSLSDKERRFEKRKQDYEKRFTQLELSCSHTLDLNKSYSMFLWNGHCANAILSPKDQKISKEGFPKANIALCICCSSSLNLGHDLVNMGKVKTYIGATCNVTTKVHNQLSKVIQKHLKKGICVDKLITLVHQDIKNNQEILSLWRYIQIIGDPIQQII